MYDTIRRVYDNEKKKKNLVQIPDQPKTDTEIDAIIFNNLRIVIYSYENSNIT